jgi:S-formylglutathione hydrolase FrmB
MGGYGAMNIALRHPDLYGQVVAIAGYFHPDDTSGIFDADPAIEAANSPDQHISAAAGLRVMLADGQDDTEAVVEGETQRFAALLQGAGQRPTVLIAPGGHDWAFVTSVLPDVEGFLEAGWPAGRAPVLPRGVFEE